MTPCGQVSGHLPQMVSIIQTIAALGIFVSIILSMRMLPPRFLRNDSHSNV